MDIYEEKLQELFEQFKVATKFVVATSKENRVTARTMSCICVDGAIYFQTDNRFLKYNQLLANPQVALCINNIQIEGIASILGKPLDAKNLFFAKLFEQYYKSSFDSYTALETEVLIQVDPTRITVWEYEEDMPIRIIFDLVNKEYLEEPYLYKERNSI